MTLSPIAPQQRKTGPNVEVFTPNVRLVVLLWLGIVAGAILRCINLNAQSYWYDEAFSWDVSAKPLGAMFAALVHDFVQPPLHYMLLHFWLAVTGANDQASAGRWLVAILGIACLPALYWLGREMFDRRTATIAVILLAFSQLGIAYSQEVRPYSQLMLLIILTLAAYVRAVRRHSGPAFGAFVLFATMALATHYFAGFMLAALLLWHLLYARNRLPWWWVALGVAGCCLGMLPWLLSGVVEAALASTKATSANQPFYFDVNWNTPFQDLAAFANARSFNVIAQAKTPWRIAVGAALFCAPMLLLVRHGPGTLWLRGEWRPAAVLAAGAILLVAITAAQLAHVPAAVAFLIGLCMALPLAKVAPVDTGGNDGYGYDLLLALLVLVPVLAAYVAGLFGVQHAVRYEAAALAAFYLLAARGITRMTPPTVRMGWVAAIVLFSLLGVRVALTAPTKENYRDALALIHAQVRPSDCIAFVPSDELPAQWRLYGYDDRALHQITSAQAAAGGPGCDALWLVRFHRVPVPNRRGKVIAAATATHRPLIASQAFHWITVDHFGKLAPTPATLE